MSDVLPKAPLLQGQETVLVVEDEPVLRELAVLTLRRSGYVVLQASDGAEALQIADAHLDDIHLLLTDAVMPNMGGAEMARRLRGKRPNIRILVVTGYTEDRFSGGNASFPDAAFLPKPYTPSGLLARVREALTQPLL